jgi:uncharacterized protein YjbI with pentapeptide repeats
MPPKVAPIAFSLVVIFGPTLSLAQSNRLPVQPPVQSTETRSPDPKPSEAAKPAQSAKPPEPLKPDQTLIGEMPCSLRFGNYSQQNYCQISVNRTGMVLLLQPQQSSRATRQSEQRSMALTIPAAQILGIYARAAHTTEPAADAVSMEIDFLMNAADTRTGNLSNSLKLYTSTAFEIALRQRLSPTADFLPRLRLTSRPFGDRTAQRQQLLDTKTCVRCDLTGVDLSGADLTGANLEGASLEGTDLRGANLKGAYLVGTDFNNANLTNADLSYAKLTFATLQAADLNHANLNAAAIQNALFQNANLSNAQVQGADMTQSNLERANLAGSNLSHYSPKGETLATTPLPLPADTAASTPAALTNYYITVLRGANLRNANLQGADLQHALIDRTNLSGANLTGARLSEINSKAATFCNAIMPDGSQSRQGC